MGDNITRPDHYCEGRKYEPKDVIRDWGLNFNLGSAVKYISRAGRKGDKLEDLKKAKQFLQFEIEATSEGEDLKRIIRKIDNDELTIDNISRKDTLFESHVTGVLNGTLCIVHFTVPYQTRIIDRIVGMIDNDDLDCFDISSDLYCGHQDIRDAIGRQVGRKERKVWYENIAKEHKDDIGMTCKEAEEIERMTRAYVSCILTRVAGFNSIPDEYKPRVIDKIAQEVLDNPYDIDRDIPTKELQDMVISRIVERINKGELNWIDIPDRCRARLIDKMAQKVLDSHCGIVRDIPTNELRQLLIDRIVEIIDNGYFDHMDIPTSLYEDCRRILSAIACREYHKETDGKRKSTENAEDTVSVNFEFEVDPTIDTDTVNVHVHIKNKED